MFRQKKSKWQNKSNCKIKVKQKERLKEMMLGPQRLFQLAGLSLFSLIFAWLLWLVVFSNIGDRYGDAIYSLYSSCWEYYILELSCGRLHPTLCVSPSKSFHLSNFIDSYAHVCVAMVLWLRPSSFMFVFFRWPLQVIQCRYPIQWSFRPTTLEFYKIFISRDTPKD